MHSSRMRTSALYRTGGGGGFCQGGLCPGGFLSRGVFGQWVSVRGEGVSVQGISVQKGSLSRGVYVQGGLCPRDVSVRETLPVNRMTDRCKNITLPQNLFATVKINCAVHIKLFPLSFSCLPSDVLFSENCPILAY